MMTMQPDELKAIRVQLGLNQGKLAATLGLTGQYVGMMERGQKPIEPRTALAVRYLAEHPEAVL
jgi:DNA-binding transcriptional regulator YiaG